MGIYIMKQTVSIVVYGLKQTFVEVTNAISVSLTQLGFSVENVIFDITRTKYEKLSDINIFIMGRWVDLELPKDSYNIFYQFEQWGNNDKYNHRHKYDLVLDIFNDIHQKYDSVFCPIGYSPMFENTYNLKVNEKYDCFFFGSIKRCINRETILNQYNIKSSNAIWGKKRDQQISTIR